jgi:hypothetical protein
MRPFLTDLLCRSSGLILLNPACEGEVVIAGVSSQVDFDRNFVGKFGRRIEIRSIGPRERPRGQNLELDDRVAQCCGGILELRNL